MMCGVKGEGEWSDVWCVKGGKSCEISKTKDHYNLRTDPCPIGGNLEDVLVLYLHKVLSCDRQ